MNNFDALKQYMIPANTLNNMLDVYKSIGQNKFLIDTLGDSKYYLMEQGLEKDTFFLASIINLNITDNRMRLLLTKNSNPVNNEEKAFLHEYLYFSNPYEVGNELIRAALASVCNLAIIPFWDYLQKGAEARINTPSVLGGNWTFRIEKNDMNKDLCAYIAKLTKAYRRCEIE